MVKAFTVSKPNQHGLTAQERTFTLNPIGAIVRDRRMDARSPGLHLRREVHNRILGLAVGWGPWMLRGSGMHEAHAVQEMPIQASSALLAGQIPHMGARLRNVLWDSINIKALPLKVDERYADSEILVRRRMIILTVLPIRSVPISCVVIHIVRVSTACMR